MDAPPEDDQPAEPIPDLGAMRGLIEGSSYAGQIADVAGRRRRMYEALAGSDDPLWREIGKQLRDGQMQPRDILRVDAYREHFQRGLAEHQADFREAVAAAREQLEAESEQRGRDR